MYNLIEDLSAVTQVPELTLKKIMEKADYIISYDVLESKNNGESITECSIGFGTLRIKIDEEGLIKYQFVPSKQLSSAITNAVVKDKSPLICELESSISAKVIRSYKELL